MADINKLRENLEKFGYKVSYYETGAEAAAAIAGALHGTTVGIGGSKTVEALGLYDLLSKDNQVFWHWKQPVAEARANSQAAAVYLTSANAVAETGEILNIDGDGNRLAASTYGKDKVYIIIGVNKITPDYESALYRARNVAAPLNARRLTRKTPCAMGEEVKCYNCSSPERICHGLSVFWRKMNGVQECEVVIINEELGY